MRLDQLLSGIEVLGGRGDPSGSEVTAVTHDSRAVRPGALFCCVRGEHADGHAFAGDAAAAGAVALLCERPVEVDLTQVVVADTRAVLGPIAARFHGEPSRHLAVVGVTGTNGKTTTTHLLGAVLEAAGRPTAVLGTLSGPRTTPEATELQATLAAERRAGRAAVSMEVSSHALAMHRVDGTWFSVAVFTNLSQDHLDFHGDMEQYFRAKASLFEPQRAAEAVVNSDDPHGQLLLQAPRIPTRSYSLGDARDLEVGSNGSRFRLDGQLVELRLAGRFNVSNALAAAAAARALGVPSDAIALGLSSVASLPGRFESVDEGQAFALFVDYAHTPAGLEVVLSAARAAAGEGGRVIVVFGCGGDRDRAKRPAMGDVASRLADFAVLTNDNPRHEDPRTIIDEVLEGVRDRSRLRVEPDRRAAITLAIGEARTADVVVLAGKGHEETQDFGARVLPFDDRQVARQVLQALSPSTGSSSTGGHST